MREIVKIGAAAGSQYPGDWRKIAKELVDPLHPVEILERLAGYDFVFDYYPPQAEEIVQQLREKGFASTLVVNRTYTKKELLAAEYLILGHLGHVNARGRTMTKHTEPICPYCRFEEKFWHYETLQIREKPKGYKLAFVDYHVKVMSRMLAEELWALGVTGLVTPPVGGEEPAEWYGIRSDHILPPVQIPPTRLTFAAYRTEECEPSHGIARLDSPLYYRRTDFKALDFNYACELRGDKWAGVRTLVISQRVYHKLVDLGVRGLQCEPVVFVE